MKVQRFGQIGVLLVGIYVTISLCNVIYSVFNPTSRFARTYNWYLVPGPFFTDETITESVHMLVQWKMEGTWSVPINTSLINYTSFITSGNIEKLNQSRLERFFYKSYIGPVDSTFSPRAVGRKWEVVKRYFNQRYNRRDADSTRFIFIRKDTRDFTTHIDTIGNVLF